jgi:hypothetical protein
MKAPRIHDFDPNAAVPELGSPLAGMPVIQKPQANRLLSERPNASTPVRSNGKRIITRNSFEIYEDQMDSLRKLSFQEKMDGKLGSMSQMVRTAIDIYLAKASERHT